MRFERLGETPVAVFEIKTDGTNVVTRIGVVGGDMHVATQTFATAAEAEKHVAKKVAQRRAEGYIEIKRLAAGTTPEPPVLLEERFEWTDRDAKRFRIVTQRDHQIRVVDGTAEGDVDLRDEPIVETWKTSTEAGYAFDGWISRTREMIEDAKMGNAKYAQKRAARKRQQDRSRFERNVNPALEAQCRASLDSSGPWQVYADWLLERGDPMGEIAARGLAGADAAKTEAMNWFEELHAEDEQRIDFALRHGFVHHLEIRVPSVAGRNALPDLVRSLLISPACRFVDSLRLGLAMHAGYENDWAATLSAITDAPQAMHIRELRFDAYDSRDCEISWVPYGDLAFAWPKLPALEVLHIRAGGTGKLGDLDLPKLKTFIRESGGLRRPDVASICAVPRPNLVHLELWSGTVNYESEIGLDDLAPIFDGGTFPALRHLGIVNSELSDELIPALASSQILPQLHSLDLSKGIAARAATTALVQNAPRFRHLASLDLSSNLLYQDEVAELRAVLDNIITVDQREEAREDDFEDDPGERYVEVGE